MLDSPALGREVKTVVDIEVETEVETKVETKEKTISVEAVDVHTIKVIPPIVLCGMFCHGQAT